MRKIFQVAAFLLLMVLKAAAQSTFPDVGNGQTAPPTLPDEHNKTNVFTASLTLANLYDSNYLSTNDNRLGNFNWFVQPLIAAVVSRPHVDWTLNYSPTLTIDQRFGVNSLFSHNLGFNLMYRPTRHLTVRVRESLRVETNLLDRVAQQPSTPESSVLDRPNELVLPPIARRLYEEAGVDVGYLLERYTMIGISGSFAQTSFRNLPNQIPVTGNLIDSRIGGGRAYFSHRLTRRQSVGAVYQLYSFLFQGGEARAITHSILYTHFIELTPSTSLSLFAGPEFSRIHNQILVNLNLFPLIAQLKFNAFVKPTSFSGGATYEWEGKRMFLLGSLASRVSDGGGLFGASRLQAATGEVRRQLAPRWTVSLALSYGTTSALGLSRSFSSSTTFSATPSLSWALAEHVALDFHYARQHQVGHGAFVLVGPVDHNLFYASLTYQFARPLGR